MVGLVSGLVVTALAGCASIPHTGPVVPGRPVGDDPRDGVFLVIPEGPVEGVGPDQIVAGFLHAAAGFADDHRVARSFLSMSRRLTWRPDTSIVVYPGERAQTPILTTLDGKAIGHRPVTPEMLDSATSASVTVRVPVEARIDAAGRYSIAAPGETATAKFGLIRQDGEWRISVLSDGILITATDFAVTFRPFPVYFPDPSGDFLVPDVHWFPGNREVPTALVRALLDGPSPWLDGAVTTGAPSGTEMAVAAVLVSGDVATVDLTERVRSATTRQRQLLLAQLDATLGQLRTITTVRITAQRLPFDIPGSGTSGDGGPPDRMPRVQTDPQVDSRPVVLDAAGRIARLVGRELEPVNGVRGLNVAGATHPAVAADSSAYAVLGPGRASVLLQLPGTAAAATVIRGTNLTPPSFDPRGWVWSAPQADTGTVVAARQDAPAREVAAPWLAGYQVVSLRASRDDARVLIAAHRGGRAAVFVSGVVRDNTGRPVSLNEPLKLTPDLVGVADAAWVDQVHVVVLGRRMPAAGSGVPGGVRPWIIHIGGRMTEMSPAPGALTIAAGKGDETLVAGTAAGTLVRVGARWELVAGARWPAYAG